MINRVNVRLPKDEYAALWQLCREELRLPSDQLRALARDELKRRGLLPPEAKNEAAQPGNNGR